MTSSLKFGTSGLRGLVTDLAGLPAYRYARAFAEMIRTDAPADAPPSVLIGQDLRASSPAIARLAMQGVSDAGLTPVDCGCTPTPALALAAMGGGHAAIMITGSHIPDDRNGLKFYRASGEIDKADEARILALHAALPDAPLPDLTVAPAFCDVGAAYLDRYVSFFGPQVLSGLRVGVYQHSSVGRDLIMAALERLGASPVALGRAERFIPVDTEALRPEDEALALGWAAGQNLDAIVSTDGDADRPLIADGTGRFLRGDLVGAMTAAFLGADVVVTPVTSNSALEGCGTFSRVLRTRVGSPYVIAGMADALAAGAGTVVGFEANGGVLLGSCVRRGGRVLAALPTRDALLPILCVLASVADNRQPLNQLAGAYGFAVALSDRVQDVPAERSSALITRIQTDAAYRVATFAPLGGIIRMDMTDGLRMTSGQGDTLHFRASGNAPELRVYVEAGDAARAREVMSFGLALAETARG